jgi:hypothetical protein
VADIYLGPYDNGSAIPPGKTPDWINPHSRDYRNPAITVVPAAGHPGCVYINVFARNHSNAIVQDVTLRLFGVAGYIDWSRSIPQQLEQLAAAATEIAPSPWGVGTLQPRPYPYEINPWNTGQLLWHVPQEAGGRYVLFATITTPNESPGPCGDNQNPYDRSRDALYGVFSSVRPA